MKKIRLFTVLVLVTVCFQLMGCVPATTSSEKIKPASLEEIEGTDIKRVILTEKAAERLDIQTVPVREESVSRKQLVKGVVVASPEMTTVVTAPASGTVLAPSDARTLSAGMPLSAGQTVFRFSFLTASTGEQSYVNLESPADAILLRLLAEPGQFVEAGQPLFEVANLSQVWVRVLIHESTIDLVDHDQGARILLLDADDEDDGLEAESVDEVEGEELEDDDEPGDVDFAVLYYGVSNTDQALSLGQNVQVEIVLSGNGATQKVIPYAAVIYDVEGNAWVYTNPEPLVFVRQPIVIDYIEGDLAILLDGPEAETAVVTVGAAELFGAETGVSK
ncbi:MAG: efflux RND transporter periplasmic adaptor subunit [Chloroflexota bacterium]